MPDTDGVLMGHLLARPHGRGQVATFSQPGEHAVTSSRAKGVECFPRRKRCCDLFLVAEHRVAADPFDVGREVRGGGLVHVAHRSMGVSRMCRTTAEPSSLPPETSALPQEDQ